MPSTEIADAAVQPAAPLKGKTVLVVSSGPLKKRFIFQRIKALGAKIVLLNKDANWAARYADALIQADPYDRAECIARVEEFLREQDIHGAVTFWEDAIPLCAALCERFGWIGNSLESALNARNKLRTREVLAAAKLQAYSAPFARVKSAKDLARECARIGFPCVLKPAWGASSQFVVLLDNLDEAKDALEYVQANLSPKFDSIYTHGTELMIEKFLPGAEIDVELLLQDGEVRFHAFTDNFPTAAPFFLETGDAMPSRHEDSDLAAVHAMAVEAVRALGLRNGSLHVEAKISPDGPRLIEVNARMGGDYLHDWVRTVWGVDLIEESLRVALGLPVKIDRPAEPKTHLVGKYLIPSSSGVISGFSGPTGPSDKEKIHDVAFLKEAGDPVLVPPEGFEDIGWIVGRGNTYAEAELNLDEALKGVHITITKFDSTSSIGKTRRRNRFNAAQVARGRIIQSARMEKIRGAGTGGKTLHVGILCNRYEEGSSAKSGSSEDAVHQDLTSVGLNIQKALEARGHRTTFFDMNETPLPFEKIADANVDLVFNVCERINNSSLLEPHAAGILDCLGIPYTGSNPLSLALCIDKIKVKKLLEQHGLPTPRYDYVFHKDEAIREDLRYPLIVKPANTDNSIGISNKSVVTSLKDLKEQVHFVLQEYRRPALIEEFIEGDEVDVSILGNEERVKVLPLSRSTFDELPSGVWHIYPFQAKWSEASVYDKIRTERPAKFSQKLTQLISEICLDAYNIFDCHDYARIECRVDKAGNPYIIEINPNPSINRGDCVPACAEMIGLDYEAFIDEILRETILRYRARPPYYHLQSSLVSL
ncbi:MAG TPA: ATP-grasp domain-containing protein [Elusimicrobiota bacterium]|nr:ATP-grasp domain-containing protein [Elusimicrobiota bacterium]